MKKISADTWWIVICVALLVVLCSAAFAIKLYQSHLQAEVYQREGINMSAWEVFWNARPAERTINIK